MFPMPSDYLKTFAIVFVAGALTTVQNATAAIAGQPTVKTKGKLSKSDQRIPAFRNATHDAAAHSRA